LIGLASTLIATAIGTVVGIVAGWFQGERGPRVPAITLALSFGAIAALVYERGRVAGLLVTLAMTIYVVALLKPKRALSRGLNVDLDSVLMRTVDIGLSFPFLLLVMAIGAALEKTSVGTILLVLGFTGWLGTARIVRARTMQLRHLEFIDAARALGQKTPRVLLFHVLPNVAGPIVVIATAQVAQMIIAESVLAFLGAGVSPPTPTWGGMLAQGQDYVAISPRLVLAPAIAILLTVLGFNLIGEGLRDALDPRDAGRLEADGDSDATEAQT
jgi:peptide/nickel transport system permease protein